MENKIESSEVKTKNKTLSLILGWILGVIFGLTGIVNIFSDPLSGLFFILAALVALPPVTKYVGEKYNYSPKRSIKISAFILCLVMASVVSKDKVSDPVVIEKATTEKSAPVVVEQQNEVPPPAPLSIEDKVRRDITSALGDQTNMKKPRVISIEVDKYDSSMLSAYGYKPEDEEVSVFIKINSSENLTNNLQKGTMNDEASKVFKNVFLSDHSIADIILWSYLPTQDQYGNEKDDVAIVYSMSRNLFKKINWSNFYSGDLPNLLKTESRIDERSNYFEKVKFK